MSWLHITSHACISRQLNVLKCFQCYRSKFSYLRSITAISMNRSEQIDIISIHRNITKNKQKINQLNNEWNWHKHVANWIEKPMFMPAQTFSRWRKTGKLNKYKLQEDYTKKTALNAYKSIKCFFPFFADAEKQKKSKSDEKSFTKTSLQGGRMLPETDIAFLCWLSVKQCSRHDHVLFSSSHHGTSFVLFSIFFTFLVIFRSFREFFFIFQFIRQSLFVVYKCVIYWFSTEGKEKHRRRKQKKKNEKWTE